MRHLLIILALASFVGLDVIFVHFSDTSAAALTFAVLSFTILLMLSVSAGTFVEEPEDYTTFLGPLLGPGLPGFLVRALLASFVPVALVLVVAYVPDLERLGRPSDTIQLGATLAIFWLFGILALVGAVLGFLWPRTGAFESVVVGGLVILAQSLISWAKVDATRAELQLALYDLMIWATVCLIGAWIGLVLRQISDYYLFQAEAEQPPEQFQGQLPEPVQEGAPEPVILAPPADQSRQLWGPPPGYEEAEREETSPRRLLQ